MKPHSQFFLTQKPLSEMCKYFPKFFCAQFFLLYVGNLGITPTTLSAPCVEPWSNMKHSH
jgi:hypothetical protein